MSSEVSDDRQSSGGNSTLDVGRRLSAATVLFHSAVADSLGLNVTDLKCWDQLVISGPATAGYLADITGLTTGAITAVVDRLEKSGYVQRESDPNDRRVVIIRPLLEREESVSSLYAPLGKAMDELMQQYKPEEMYLVMELLDRAIRVLQTETKRLRQLDS